MTVLALDTSTLVASVAVVTADGVLASRDSDVSTHSDNLLPLIDEVLTASGLALADLDGIAAGAGPGSFTGLRIGIATAKGLAFAADKPLWLVSSLAALAQDFADQTNPRPDALLVPVIDARRQEIFAGFYRRRGDQLEAIAEERVLRPDALAGIVSDLATAPGTTHLVGDGVTLYANEFQGVGTLHDDARTTPSAVSVGGLTLTGEQTDVLVSGVPAYIRPSEVEIKFPNGNPGGTFSTRGRT